MRVRTRALFYTKQLAELKRTDLVIVKEKEKGVLPPSYHPGISVINDPRFIELAVRREAKPLKFIRHSFIPIVYLAGFLLFIEWARRKLPYRPVANNTALVTDRNGEILNLRTHPWAPFFAWISFKDGLLQYSPGLLFLLSHFKKYPQGKRLRFYLLNIFFGIMTASLGCYVASFRLPGQDCQVWDRYDRTYGETGLLAGLSALGVLGSRAAGLFLAFYLVNAGYKLATGDKQSGHRAAAILGPPLGVAYALLCKRIA